MTEELTAADDASRCEVYIGDSTDHLLRQGSGTRKHSTRNTSDSIGDLIASYTRGNNVDQTDCEPLVGWYFREIGNYFSGVHQGGHHSFCS